MLSPGQWSTTWHAAIPDNPGKAGMSSRRPIHTTLDKDTKDWLDAEEIRTKCNQNEILEKTIAFYRKHKGVEDELLGAKGFIMQLIREEVSRQFEGFPELNAAKPFLGKLVKEVLEEVSQKSKKMY
jgi:hypothetical protein